MTRTQSRSRVLVLVCVVLVLPCVAMVALADDPRKQWCSMQGRDGAYLDPTIYDGPPFKPDPPLIDCTEFDELACCTAEQTHQFKISFKQAITTFFRCPACLDNMKKMWCHYTCSPYQASFVKVTSAKPDEKTPQGFEIVGTNTFTVTEPFAEAIYASCADNPFAGGAKLSTFVSTPRAFMDLLQSGMDGLTVDIAPTGLTTDMAPQAPCNSSCSCNFCSAACTVQAGRGDNNGPTTVQVFSLHLTYLQVGLTIGYMVFAISIIGIAVGYFIGRMRRRSGYEDIDERPINVMQTSSLQPRL